MTYHPIEDSVGFLIGQTYRKINHLISLQFKAYDLTTEQWVVLSCLLQRDGIHQTELAEMSKKDKTTITRILDTLERKRMIIKRPNPDDRRAYFIELTELGRRRATDLTEIERQTMNRLVSMNSDSFLELKQMLLRLQQLADEQLKSLSRDQHAETESSGN